MYVAPCGTMWDHVGPYGTKVVPKMVPKFFEYARDVHGLLVLNETKESKVHLHVHVHVST